tara:strand:+ start:83 stop:337 length:255 start_codon:yes stop_codon:yes gene_type:complete
MIGYLTIILFWRNEMSKMNLPETVEHLVDLIDAFGLKMQFLEKEVDLLQAQLDGYEQQPLDSSEGIIKFAPDWDDLDEEDDNAA